MNKCIVGCLVCSFLLFPYLSSAAISPDATLRSQLFALIELLQLQILVLEEGTKTSPVESYIDGGIQTRTAEVSMLAQYDRSSSGEWDIENDIHFNYAAQLLQTWPVQYSDRITQLVIFDESKEMFDAYVETDDFSLNQWTFGVGDELVAEPAAEASVDLLFHEMAHVFAYDGIPGVNDVAMDCHAYFEHTTCPTLNTYLGSFIESFWSDEQLTDAARIARSADIETAAYQYYLRHPNEFVTDYAAQSPEEDFAESFMYYARDLDAGCTDCVAARKKQFFTQFPELLVGINKTRGGVEQS